MKKSEDAEDIEINERRTDKVYFESNWIQQIYDGIDFLRDESIGVLKELDIEGKVDDLELEGFAEDTIDQIDDILDEISQFKDSVVDTDDLPDDVKQHYRNTQAYFNRDADYLRRAKSKLARLKTGKLTEEYKTYVRIIELCDKAIAVRSDNFDAYVFKAQVLVNLEKYEDAIEEYINALAIKDDIDIWLAIANINRLNGDFDDANEVYDTILDKSDKTFEVLKGKALVSFSIGDYETCDKLFKQANDIEYLDEDSFKIWSECLEQLKKD